MAPVGGAGVYDLALKKRQALMGASGPAALVKNSKVFLIACFACIGGLLYGYNQSMFGSILVMPSFMSRKLIVIARSERKPLMFTDMGNYDSNDPEDSTRKGWLVSILELGAWLGTLMAGFVAEVASRKYGVIIASCVFIL